MKWSQSGIIARVDHPESGAIERFQMTRHAVFRGVVQRTVAEFIERDPVCVRGEQLLRGERVRDKQRRAAEVVGRFDLRGMLQQLFSALGITMLRRQCSAVIPYGPRVCTTSPFLTASINNLPNESLASADTAVNTSRPIIAAAFTAFP